MSPKLGRIALTFIGIFLLLSGASKVLYPSETHVLNLQILGFPGVFSIVHGAVEIIAAVLLISNWDTAKYCCVLLFCAYLGILFSSIRNNISDCGCFSAISVSPTVMIGVDFLVLLILFEVMRRNDSTKKDLAKLMCVSVLVGVAVGFIHSGGLTNQSYEALRLGAVPQNQPVLLTPQEWRGKEMPLTKYTSCSPPIAMGQVTAVLVRPDCDACKKMVSDLDTTNAAVHLIWIKPPADQSRFTRFPQCFVNTKYNFVVKTPTVIHLVDRIVQ